jgi:D-aminopeptidase
VGECNDSYLNAINKRVIAQEHVFEAIERANTDFLEGDVGAGKGMSCHNLKGGIGSASRVLQLAQREFTLGALVLANYGALGDLTIDGEKVGQTIKDEIANRTEADKGSIIIVLATDLPLSDRQLKRVCKRATVGMSRVGSYIGHGSGDIVIGFTTHPLISASSESSLSAAMSLSDKSERCEIQYVAQLEEELLETVFRAAAEVTEESILNALVTANETTGVNGRTRYALKDFWRK